MKKLITFAVISAVAVATPAFAQSKNDEDIKSDVQAIDKDNAAIQKDKDNLANNRAAKTADKQNEDYGKQAVDSVKIGADKAAIAEKKTEKHVDKKILKHHKKKAAQDNGDSQTSTVPASQ